MSENPDPSAPTPRRRTIYDMIEPRDVLQALATVTAGILAHPNEEGSPEQIADCASRYVAQIVGAVGCFFVGDYVGGPVILREEAGHDSFDETMANECFRAARAGSFVCLKREFEKRKRKDGTPFNRVTIHGAIVSCREEGSAQRLLAIFPNAQPCDDTEYGPWPEGANPYLVGIDEFRAWVEFYPVEPLH